jgi:MinD superfamily P-loop ATPase
MIIAVASGKGGTGKTTIATSLALALSNYGLSTICIDCDVEAPNAHIFIKPFLDQEKAVSLSIPQVDLNLCTACGRCAEVCQFHAIVVLGGEPLVFPQLCHGCGSCTLECPEKAITEIPKILGWMASGKVSTNLHFAHGKLKIGEPMAVPVINQLKEWQDFSKADIVILDSPPGASCPVVASIRGSDFVLLVTEPTPFGLHDLKQAVQLSKELKIPVGVIINREGIGDCGVENYCIEADLPILMRIPFDWEIGEGLARGKTLLEVFPKYQQQFLDLYQRIAKLEAREGIER